MLDAILRTIGRWQGVVEVPRTRTRTEYISRSWALNLADDVEMGGDWHRACWFMATPTDPTGPTIDRGSTIGVLADAGIYDCRKALRRLGHPQGWRAEPIWAARYARACVDMVALNMARETREGLPKEWGGLKPTAHDMPRLMNALENPATHFNQPKRPRRTPIPRARHPRSSTANGTPPCALRDPLMFLVKCVF